MFLKKRKNRTGGLSKRTKRTGPLKMFQPQQQLKGESRVPRLHGRVLLAHVQRFQDISRATKEDHLRGSLPPHVGSNPPPVPFRRLGRSCFAQVKGDERLRALASKATRGAAQTVEPADAKKLTLGFPMHISLPELPEFLDSIFGREGHVSD